jgi:hypothetical protein
MSTPTEHPPVFAERTSAAAAAGHAAADRAVHQVGSRARHLLGRGWRKMTWVMITWSAFILVVAVATAGNTDSTMTSSCQSTLGDGSLCDQVGSQNAAAQFEHVMKIGVVGFAILSIIWFMSRPQDK